MLPFLLSVAGLSIDGGAAFNARLRLQQVAGAAARAGATQIDERAYRESNGASVVLDGARARRVASDYLARSGLALTGTVRAESRRVVVQVYQDVPTSFLRILGLTGVRIGVTAPAELRYGVGQGAG
jgi:Flp pilus assembly protein TadG